MRILFVVPKVPFPPTDGGRVVMYNTAKTLSRAGHEIGFACLIPDGETLSPEFCREFPVWYTEADLHTKPVGLLRSIFTSIPYSYWKHQPRSFLRVVARAAACFKPDIVQVDFLHVGIYGLLAGRQQGVPVILRMHNVDSSLMARFQHVQLNPLVRLYAALQERRLRFYESEYLRRFDRCVAITDDDARLLSRIGGISVDVVPSGVDTSYFSPSGMAEEPDSVVSVALMNWMPNIVSTRWFLNQVFPFIQRQIPGVKFFIVGKGPPSDIRRHSDGKSVLVTGFVDDVRPWFAKSAVVVVPTRVGSGMRIKILESLAMGKAVVSTRVGCEGIAGLVDGENVVIADSERDFAAAVVRLLKNKRQRERQGSAGRRLVMSRYQWAHVGAEFERIYRETLGKYWGNA